jgi:hypothetical protein
MFAVLAVLVLAFYGRVLAIDATEARNPEAEPVIAYGATRTGIDKIAVGPNYIAGGKESKMYFGGPCRVYSINIYGDTAGDMIALYNNENADDLTRLEYEVAIAANTCSNSIDLNGVYFDKELYISLTDGTNSFGTVSYDY